MNSHTSEDRSSAGSSRPVKSSMRSDSGVRVRSQNSARFDDNVGVIPPKSPDSDGGEARDEATEHEMFERMRSMQKEILETQGPEDAAVQDAGRQSVLSEFSDVDFFEDSEPTSESEGEDDNERYNELKILEKYTHPATGVVSTMSTEAQRADRKRNMELIRQMENADNDLREKQRAVESCNDELALTKSAFNSLREEANRLSHELRDASGADAIPAVKEQRVRRLQAALDKCLAQMAMQESAVGRAEDALRVADADVSRAELARMHLTSISEEARAVLEQYEQENVVLARVRAAKEAEFDRSQARRRRRHEAKVAAAWREQEERIIRAMEAARDGHRKATERLETTLSQKKEEDITAATRARREYEKRMGAIIGLKGNMDQIRESIVARHDRRTKAAAATAEREAAERAEILAQGGNPDVVFRQRLARQIKEKERREHERRQSERQLEIVQKLVAEDTARRRGETRSEKKQKERDAIFDEEARRQRRAMQSRRWKGMYRTDSPTSEDGSSSLTSRDYEKGGVLASSSATIMRRVSGIDREESASPGKMSSPTLPNALSSVNISMHNAGVAESSAGAASDKDESSASSEDEVLAVPEFQGMWGDVIPSGRSNTRKAATMATHSGAAATEVTGHQQSKMEKEMMEKALIKQRASVVRKQVVAGKEFKGIAFSAKPDRVIFKDFEVGKVYKKKVTFTNISYSVNTFRPLDIPANLSEFVTLEHTPPGHLSAGLTCEVTVVFKPLVNEDLAGELPFLAETGPFTLAIECVTRKCHARLSANAIDFGDVCLGESVVRSIKILGEGALPTQYKIVRLNESDERIDTAAASLLTAADVATVAATPSAATVANSSDQPSVRTSIGTHKDLHSHALQPTSTEASPALSHAILVDGTETRKGSSENLASSSTSQPAEFGFGMIVRRGEAGEVGAYSQCNVEFAFAPMAVGPMEASFEVIFDDPSVEPQRLYLRGRGTDVPIFVERDSVDLRMCMFDRMYRDVLLINNRGSVAQRIRLNVPKELKGFLEITPKKTALVQAHSSLTAQLRFVPGPALFKHCREYIDSVTGQLDISLEICVHGQVLPVTYRLRAIVTPSDIEFDVPSIEFGPATVHESVRVPFVITNRSALPQKFGFVGLPKHAEVQPNDGFGVLLPYEHIHLDAIFSPMSAGEFSFPLRLRSAIGREFLLPCTGVGIHPPIRLSSSVIELLPTAIGDEMSESIYATNTDRSPQAFEFYVPEGAPVKVSPVVGILQPGQRTRVIVTFAPRLDFGDDDDVDGNDGEVGAAPSEHDEHSIAGDDLEESKSGRKSAVPGQKGTNSGNNNLAPVASGGALASASFAKRNQQAHRLAVNNSRPTSRAGDGRAGLSRQGSTKSSQVNLMRAAGVKGSSMQEEGSQMLFTQQDAETLERQLALRIQRQRAYTGSDGWFRLSCFVRPARHGVHAADSDGLPLADEPCDVRRTVYLDVHARSVPPPIVILSNGGEGSLEFGRIPLGQPAQLSIVIQNVSEEKQHVKSSILCTKGPFDIINALRCLEPGEKHDIYVSFVPQEEAEFFEVLEIRSHACRIPVRLSGVGVQPTVTIEPRNGLLDLGDVLVGDTAHKTFTVRNTSAFEVTYRIVLDGTTSARERANMGLSAESSEMLSGVDEIDIDFDTGLPLVRRSSMTPTANANNMNAFDIVPSEATLAAGESREVVVTFSPDHQSKYYRDTARVQVSSQQEQHVIHLQGRAWSRTMYVIGEDDVAANGDEIFAPANDAEKGQDSRVLLLVFKCNPAVHDGPIKRELEIGNLRGGAKKGPNGEYAFEALSADATAEGFSIEPLKGQIESGARKVVTIQFAPPRDKLYGRWVETTVPLSLKGDVTEQFLVVLRGYIII